jgi:hypothetical protein
VCNRADTRIHQEQSVSRAKVGERNRTRVGIRKDFLTFADLVSSVPYDAVVPHVNKLGARGVQKAGDNHSINPYLISCCSQ